MLRRTINEYDPDESLQTQETNSIICQIPISYDDYQNKRSSRASENTSSRANLHQRNDLKVNVPSMTHDDLDNKSREYLETDTPMFSQNKSIDAQEIQALRNVCSPDTSQDKQFKKIVEMAFEPYLSQIERLQELRDFLHDQSDRLQRTKEEIAKNSRLAMSEFTDKYRAALKQLETYFHNNLEKLKETEQEKNDFLTNKIEDNNKLITEIGSKINEMESKMKIDSVPYFIYLFETNYPQLEKFLKIPRFDETVISGGWKVFNVPYLEFNLYSGPSKSHANVASSIESRSLLDTQPKDLEAISLNKKPKHMLSPQILMNTDNSVQFSKRLEAGKESLENPAFLLKRLEATELETARSEKDREEAEIKKRFQTNPQNVFPRTNSHSRYNSAATPQNLMSRQNSRSPLSRNDETSDYSRKTRDELPPERSASRTPENREPSEDRYVSKGDRRNPSRIKERNQYETNVTNRSRDYASNTSVLKEKDKEKEAKKKTYKDVIKKLEKESKRKEKLLEDMIESYKNLEHKYEKEVMGKKKPDIYSEVLKTVSSIVKKHESQLIEKPAVYFYSKRAIDVLENDEKRWESEAILNKENNLHEYKKKTYKNLRDASKTPDYTGAQSTYEPSSPYTSTMRRNYSTNNFHSNTRRGNSLLVSKVFEDDTPLHLVESFGNQRSEEVRRRFKVYVPLGSQDSSNFFVVSAEKNDTVRDLMDTMLQHLGLDVEKSYKYYFSIKLDEGTPEKTILVASKIWSYLEASHEVRVKSWPKFFLRTYDQKEHYDIKKLR